MPSPLLPPPEAGNIPVPPRRRQQKRGKRRKEKALRRRSAFVRWIKLKEVDGRTDSDCGATEENRRVSTFPKSPRALGRHRGSHPGHRKSKVGPITGKEEKKKAFDLDDFALIALYGKVSCCSRSLSPPCS